MSVADRPAIFEHAHRVPTGLSDTFALFADPENLERLTPRWMRFRLLGVPSRLEAGARIRYRIAPFGLAT
jgi:ligand-binding SRPBCC domain-containing protein